MNSREFERRVADFYSEEGLLRAPDRVLASALTTIENTPQRRVLSRVPWRLRNMNRYFGVAAAAAVLLVGAAVGFAIFTGRPGPPGATPSPSITPGPTTSTLTETFTSAIHGMSVNHPAGWRIEPGSGPWLVGLPGTDDPPSRDTIWNDAVDNQFIGLASQSLAGRSGDEWITHISGLPEWESSCDSADSEPVTVDGATGIVVFCPERPLHAMVTDGNRGYWIVLYGSDDRSLFDEFLTTVQLDPASALLSSDPFGVPFTFRFPAGPTWDFGNVDSTYFEVRVPAFADAGHPGGLIAQVIGGGLEDPCNPSSAELEIDPGPQSVIDYLGTVPGITLVDETATTVGGLDAVQATVPASTEVPPCEAMLWTNDTEPFTGIPLDVSRRVVAVDVGGEHVVFTTYGEENNSGLGAMVDELLGSITFTSAD